MQYLIIHKKSKRNWNNLRKIIHTKLSQSIEKSRIPNNFKRIELGERLNGQLRMALYSQETN